MNAKVSMLLTAICLTGCSTPAPLPPVAGAENTALNFVRPYPKADPDLPLPQACQLGTSCLTMDPRPFEFCLLSTKSCADKGAEAMQVVRRPDPSAAASR